METFTLYTEKNLLMFYLRNKLAMIDTGSPLSLAKEPFSLLGRNYSYPPGHFLLYTDINKISASLGIELDIFLGCDVVKNYDLRICWNKQTIDIGENIPHYPNQIELKSIGNGPYFPVTIDDNDFYVFFDTGAHISYIEPQYTEGKTSIRTDHDFHPFQGNFETPIFPFTVFFTNNIQKQLEFGVLPKLLYTRSFGMLKFLAIEAIVGTELFKLFNIVISWKNNLISFEEI